MGNPEDLKNEKPESQIAKPFSKLSEEERRDSLNREIMPLGFSGRNRDNYFHLEFKRVGERLDERTRINRLQEEPELTQESIDQIAQEYKIHLMPKKDHVPAVLTRLVERLKPLLGQDIIEIKCLVSSESGDDSGNRVPEIVVYPRDLGPQAFEKVTRTVLAATEDLNGYGTGELPRFNFPVNELVTVAQSGGDFKSRLQGEGRLDQVFDKSAGYAFRPGEFPAFLEKRRAITELCNHIAQNERARKLLNAVLTGVFPSGPDDGLKPRQLVELTFADQRFQRENRFDPELLAPALHEYATQNITVQGSEQEIQAKKREYFQATGAFLRELRECVGRLKG